MNTYPPQTSGTSGHLYLVGVGPGDPELMTYKAVRILSETAVWAVPRAKSTENSQAQQIADTLIDSTQKTILKLTFLMKKVHMGQQTNGQQAQAWHDAADEVLRYLDQGQDVAFPTLGDPGLYSTAFYLFGVLQEMRPELQVTVIPGITAMSACSAGLCSPLALGDDVLSVVPAAFSDDRLREILSTLDALVLMKVHRRFEQLFDLLEELNLVDKAVLIERCGLEGEHVYTDIRQARGKDLHYFSTMLIRKKHFQVAQS